MKEIYLTKGKVTFVDYELLNSFNWQYWTSKEINYGYAATKIYVNQIRTSIHMHRMILNASRNVQVDHIDRNGLNNQRYNLRLVNRNQQKQNQIKQKGCSSKYKGIHYSQQKGVWRANIYIDRIRIDLGSHHNEIAAAEMYDLAARMYFGEFARYNFPREGEQSALVEEQEIICCH